ncbi:sugar ABC transporter ATP-binding protein [Lachnoanaerobaculum orale]|jgi:ABC transporter related protein|uniref:Sugar ABC transporter ATP-binding protein n=1 Tax=Lachnoanaerobaculum orale TaxID=979627 RepID=A0A3P3Q3G9_9FIRM|nr:sugar ABC transporter ATP-binding protein [Lachnoanaerobaculum orale]RRJ15578.1 sugar ABC transporter ATP-binding protein [Lachnoanaerobaculum orale]
MENTVLKMEGICKSFGDAKVLKNVQFELKHGEVHALAGGNGAGKSTLMKIMTGVYTHDEGKIFIDGKETVIEKPLDAKEQGIAMIFQELSLVQTMTVAENIFLGTEIVKNGVRDVKKMNEKTSQILHRLGMDISPSTVVSELSVGMSQMVEIAKAVSKDAKILVFDEPTAALSDSETKRLFEIITQLKNEGVSMVYISHRMNEILSICDSITILKDGEYVTTQNIKDMTLDKIVSYMMGGTSGKGHKFEWVERKHDENAKDVLKVDHLKINEKINDISFSLKHGEIVGFAGLMGSGRTEILECLFGLRKKEGGTVILDDKEVHIKNPTEAIKNGLAFIPEDRRKEGLVLMHSIKDNAVLPILDRLSIKGIFNDDKKERALVGENIKKFGVKAEHIDQEIGLLSGGNQQKIVIAKWMNTCPKVIMLDEPTAGVDIGAKGEILEIVRSFADQGCGVLFVSSELTEMMAICDRIIVLFDGRITGMISRKDIKLEEELQNAIQMS